MSIKYLFMSIMVPLIIPYSGNATNHEDPFSFPPEVDKCIKEEFKEEQETVAERENKCYKRNLDQLEKELQDLVAQVKMGYQKMIASCPKNPSREEKKTARQLKQTMRDFEKNEREFDHWNKSFHKKDCESYGMRSYNNCYYGKTQQLLRIRIKHLQDFVKMFNTGKDNGVDKKTG